MSKTSGILLNPGQQHDFVVNNHRHSGYFGGRGAGKTFALVVRALNLAHQPIVPGEGPPKGCLLTDTFPHLKDIVYPVMYKVLLQSGLKLGKDVIEVKNQTDRKFVIKETGAEILMRSLDQPDRVRGLTISYFGIDEGRNFREDYAYKLLLACMRQGKHPDEAKDEAGIYEPGVNYRHAGFVTSTPAGYDWMYNLFHPKSPKRFDDVGWYNAPVHDNKRNLPASFIRDLEAAYDGLMHEQEVLGKFVGAVTGAVWPMFSPEQHVAPLIYDPQLPLYAGWDFGIGDASVCVFAQMGWTDKTLPDGTVVSVPGLRVLDAIEHAGLTVREFGQEYWKWLEQNTGGREPTAMWGDPAGMQRNQVTGTSTIAAFADEGIYIKPAPRRPVDEGVIILQNLMEREGGFLIDPTNERLVQAVQTYRWRTEEQNGQLVKTSNEPVHDWTSHFGSALRYLAIGAVGLHPRRTLKPTPDVQKGTWGYVMDQIMNQRSGNIEMGQKSKPVRWHPDEPVERSWAA